MWLLDCNKQIINQSSVSAAGLWLVTGAVLHSGSHFVCSPTYQCQLESGREYKPPVFHIPLQHRAAHHGRLCSSTRKINFLLKYLRREKSTQNSNLFIYLFNHLLNQQRILQIFFLLYHAGSKVDGPTDHPRSQ